MSTRKRSPGAQRSERVDQLRPQIVDLAIDALADILKCNTARKCHDRVRRALADMEALDL